MSVFGPEQLAAALAKQPALLLRKLDAGLQRHVRTFLHTIFPRERLSGPPGLSRRTGDLARSFDFVVSGSTWEDWTLVEFSRSKTAMLHERGGVVRPRSGQYLAIPIPGSPAMTGTGVSRGGPRTFQNTFIWRRGDQALIAQRVPQARQTKMVPLFVLKREVRLLPRLGFEESWQRDQQARQGIVEQAARDALEQLGSA